jgi:hypothetical protein
MTSLTTIKLKEAQKNREGYISMMAGWDDGRLSKHIDLFREQRAMAYKKGDEDAMILLNDTNRTLILCFIGIHDFNLYKQVSIAISL